MSETRRLKDELLAVAEATGIVYHMDGSNPQPGPVDDIVAEIKRLQAENERLKAENEDAADAAMEEILNAADAAMEETLKAENVARRRLLAWNLRRILKYSRDLRADVERLVAELDGEP